MGFALVTFGLNYWAWAWLNLGLAIGPWAFLLGSMQPVLIKLKLVIG